MKRIRNMRFSKKLMLTYLITISLLYLCVCVWYLVVSYRDALDLNRRSMSAIAENASQMVNIKLDTVQKAVEKINVNPQIIEILDKLDTADVPQMLEMDRDMQLILYNQFSHLEDVFNAQLITQNYRFGISDLITSFSSSMFYDSEIYAKATKGPQEPTWIPTYDLASIFPDHYYSYLDKNLRQVFSVVQKGNFIKLNPTGGSEIRNYEFDPFVLISLPASTLEKFFYGIPEDVQYHVFSAQGDVVTSSRPEEISRILSLESLGFLQEKVAGDLVMPGISTPEQSLLYYAPIPISGWTLCLEMPMRAVTESIFSNLAQMLFVFFGITLPLFIVLAWRLSRSMSQPVHELKEAMRLTKKGNFTHIIDFPHTGNEFGELIDQYNEMNLKIGTLIHENYERKLKQQESELRILNLHFNPHFIYNTLSTIYHLLENKGDLETAKLVIALIDMLRSSSRTDGEFWNMRQEIQWLDNYILIMKRRQNLEFTVDYYIAEHLLEIQILKHLLQPFVENAIIHGFAGQDRESQNHIEVFASEKEGYLTLRIHDTGKGFDAQVYNREISLQSSTTMASRTHRRIQLAYGKECGITVYSVPGEGTETVLRIGVHPKE